MIKLGFINWKQKVLEGAYREIWLREDKRVICQKKVLIIQP
jgi:hypothetical protein